MKRLGRYEILNQLGRGGMGTVYKGRDPKIDRVVAVKTISMEGQSRAEQEEFRQRFFREAQAAGALSHHGIVTIHDVGEDRATKATFIVMEYVEGNTLAELGEPERLPLKRSLDLARQVAEALDYAHGRNIVHRDIKPANIIVTSEGRAKITDFGIAKLQTSPVTQPGEVLGTPAYMSPEQLTGGAVDGRSDLFSLGVILYWLLTGNKPFLGENTSSVTYKIVYQEPVPPSQINPSLSSDFDYVIQRALAKEPGNRYQRGREFAGDLVDLKAGRPPRSRTGVALWARGGETVVSRRAKPSRVQRLAASFLAIFLDLLLLDAVIETFVHSLPTRRLVGIVVASYFALNVWLWRKMGWLARGALSSLVLLGLLAFAAWQRESCCEGIVLLRHTTSALLSVATGGAVALAGISLARRRFLGAGGRFVVVLLTVYAVAAFVSGVVAGQPYPDLYRGASLWPRLPFWLQGPFIGSFVLLPVALASLTLRGLLRSRETKFRSWGYTFLSLGLALTMSEGGFKAPRGCTLVAPFGGGSIEAFISEEAAGTYGMSGSTNQVPEGARGIYLIVQSRNTGRLSLEASWLAVSIDRVESNRKLGASHLSLEPNQRKAVSLNPARGGFSVGEYRVELSVNGGAPQSFSFKVAPILPLALPWRTAP